jgi:hypothetical protein
MLLAEARLSMIRDDWPISNARIVATIMFTTLILDPPQKRKAAGAYLGGSIIATAASH